MDLSKLYSFVSRFVYTKKLAYLVTVLTANGCLVAAICMNKGEISGTWVTVFGILGGLVTTGYLGGKKLMLKE